MGRPATLKVDIVADARGVSKGVDDADRKFSGLGKTASKLGGAVKLGMVAAGAAVVGFAASTVKAASDAQQAMGGVDAIFGRHADQVKRNAKQAADAVGLSSTQYAEMANILGSQLKNMGTASDQLVGKTDGLIKMGADLAATYGGSVADAVEAVSSLMKGETDPIERYGVSIKQSDINARLAAEGLGHLTGAAAKQAQANAVLTLLTQQTSAAHGQFAAQTNTLAERQQILAAKFDNVKVTIGNYLLPVITALFGFLNNDLMPIARSLASQLGERLGPAFRQVGAFISDHVVPAIGSLVRWVRDTLVPLLARSLGPVVDGIASLFHSVGNALDDNSSGAGRLVGFLRTLVEFIARYVLPVVGKLAGFALVQLGRSIGTVLTVVSRLIDAVGWLVDKLGQVASMVGGPLSKAASILGKLNPFSGPPLVGGVAQLVGGVGGVSAPMGQLATAAAGDPTFGAYSVTSSRPFGAGPVVVDRRDMSVTVRVDGALDPASVGRQLEELLRGHQVRMGAIPAWGS